MDCLFPKYLHQELVCEIKTKCLREQSPACSCPLWDAGSAGPALVKANITDSVFCRGMGTQEQALVRSGM